MNRCIIIGGGIGGLTAGTYLAARGMDVDLFEKQTRPGGKARERYIGPFRFDGGPTLLTMPFVLDWVAEENGIEEADKPKLHKLEETCRYFYPDGSRFHAYAEKQRLYEEVRRVMSDPPVQIAEHLAYSKNIYDLCSELFLFSSFHEFDRLMKHRDTMRLRQLMKLDPFRNMHRANSTFFRDKRLIQFADRYATYNGSNPYRVPATLNIIHHVEQLGASVPQNGIAAVPRFLEKAAIGKGVRIHNDSPADRILLDRSGVRGISSCERIIPGRRVISNVDVSTTYRRLLQKNNNIDALKYRMMVPSTSALVFYWGMKISTEDLTIHNILFSANYRKEFRELFTLKRCPSDPTVYIYISSKYNPADAPAEHENWYVMINAPYIRRQKWEEEIDKARSRVEGKIQQFLGITVKQHRVCEEIFTPQEIESRTGSYRGSLYGVSSNNMLSAFLRQGNRSKVFQGLYFTGGSAHPGGGIPLTILSGRTTAEIMTDQQT